jgi:hypothetical protein
MPELDSIATVLDGATHEINAAATKMKEAATKDNFHKFVPDYLKTTTDYWWQLTSPTLLLCLVLQLGGTFCISKMSSLVMTNLNQLGAFSQRRLAHQTLSNK